MEFCSSLLGCKISCNKPCRDGYPVTNLITNPKKEFIGESFVRPPCDIKIEFSGPIDIAYIVLQTQVGERNVRGFKIFMKSFDPEEFCLGNWFSITENRVLLKNYNYKHWLPFDLPKEEDNQTENTFTGALKNRDYRKFPNSVKSLRIVLTSVSPTGPPVLKSVHVWGQPSSSCSISQKNNIVKLWTSIQSESKSEDYIIPPVDNVDVVEENKGDKRKINEDATIPEEFLDPLTCEVMKLPILLPSGNSIDSFTLEKFLANESAWGRSASDPFTGLPFKNDYKPEANVHLKARIDRFFLVEKHIDEKSLNALGHTLLSAFADNRKESTWESKDEGKSDMESVSVTPKQSLSQNYETEATHLNARPKAVLGKPSYVNFSSPLPQKSGGSSLLHTLGSVLSAVRKPRSCVQLKTKPSTNTGPPTPLPSTAKHSLPAILDEDKYSLAGMALASLKCVCGSQNGLFYSLKCKHNTCNMCIKSQLNLSEVKNSVICGICGNVSSSEHITRIHPKSAFAL